MAVGSVAVSTNASLSGQALLPKTAIFSGDSLQVRDGIAVIAVGSNNRVTFGRDTLASFVRNSDQVTVLLNQGNISMFHAIDGTPLGVKAGEILIDPGAGFKTQGDIAVVNGSVVITAREGGLQVDDHGVTRNVAKGQTIVLALSSAKSGAASASAIGSGLAGSLGGTTGVAAGTAGLGSAATAAEKFVHPSPSRPTTPGLSGAAVPVGTQGGNCAPPSPSKPPTASTVIPFGATSGPVCPGWAPQ
jgi:hypothetical protein